MATLTLEQENAIRERNGIPKLDKLPDTPKTEEEIKLEKEAAEKKALDEKAAADVEAKRIDDEKKAEEKRLAELAKPKELTDSELLEIASKKAGRKITSWDEFKPQPTEEEKKKELESREADKLSWGLKNGKFNRKQFENFIADSKSTESLVYKGYAEKVKAAEPDIKEEQIIEQFQERFGLDKDPESWQHKQGQEELNLMASQILNKNYGSILSLDNEYSVFEKTAQEQQSSQARILENAPAYKKDVEEVFNSASVYKQKIGDEEYIIPLPPEFIERSKQHLLSEDFATTQIQKGWTKEQLSELATNMALIEHRDYIQQKVAEQYHINRQKGTRGIPADLGNRNVPDNKVIDDKKQKAAERHGSVVPTNN